MLRYNEQRNMETMFDPLNKTKIWISQCKSTLCVRLEQTGRKGKAFMWNMDEYNSGKVTVNAVEKCW